MKAITVRQPHAALMAHGVQTIWTSSKPSAHRGPLLIHAGVLGWRGLGAEVATHPDLWAALETVTHKTVLGGIVGSCNLVDVVPIVGKMQTGNEWPKVGEFVIKGDERLWWDAANVLPGHPKDITDQLPYGDFTPGRYAWLLEDAKPVEERCPACWGDLAWTEDNHHCCGGGVGCYNCDGTACPVCHGENACDPIPAKGKQGLWTWNP